MLDYDEAKQLIVDALSELPNNECPYCQAGGLISEFISDKDIGKWVKEYKLVRDNMSHKPNSPDRKTKN